LMRRSGEVVTRRERVWRAEIVERNRVLEHEIANAQFARGLTATVAAQHGLHAVEQWASPQGQRASRSSLRR
jgi:hypothetical protein